jgi:hypothetical protein
VRLDIENLPKAKLNAGPDFDQDYETGLRERWATLEQEQAEKVKPGIDAALLFLSHHAVLVYSNIAGETKIQLPDRLAA